METAKSLPMSSSAGKSPPDRDLGPALRTWLGSRQGKITAGVVLAVPAAALGWSWLGSEAMLPLLYTLPCAAMMFFCVKGMGNGQKDSATDQNTAAADRSRDNGG